MVSPRIEKGEVQRHVNKASKGLEMLSSATHELELRDGWEDFVSSAKRALEKANTLAGEDSAASSWARAHRGKYRGGDPGLTYVWEARNVLDHGLASIVDVKEATFSLGGGMIAISSNANLRMVGPTLLKPNGETVKIEDLRVTDGNVTFKGSGNPEIALHPAKIRLVSVYSESKRKTFDPPRVLCGQRLDVGNPRSLGAATMVYLERMVQDLKSWFRVP